MRERASAALSNKSVRSVLWIGPVPQVNAYSNCYFNWRANTSYCGALLAY